MAPTRGVHIDYMVDTWCPYRIYGVNAQCPSRISLCQCMVSMQKIIVPMHGVYTEYRVPMHGVHAEYHCAIAWSPCRISLCQCIVSMKNIIVPVHGVYTEYMLSFPYKLVSKHEVRTEYTMSLHGVHIK